MIPLIAVAVIVVLGVGYTYESGWMNSPGMNSTAVTPSATPAAPEASPMAPKR